MADITGCSREIHREPRHSGRRALPASVPPAVLTTGPPRWPWPGAPACPAGPAPAPARHRHRPGTGTAARPAAAPACLAGSRPRSLPPVRPGRAIRVRP